LDKIITATTTAACIYIKMHANYHAPDAMMHPVPVLGTVQKNLAAGLWGDALVTEAHQHLH
jgi:hypothetical protein